MNLIQETMITLAEHNKSLDDIVAICGSEFQITQGDFIKYSNTEYDSGYGAPEVAEDLVVVGADFWLERHEYDGSEWWEYKEMPNYKDLPFKPINALTIKQAHANGVNCSCGWETLADLNCTPTEKGGEQG